MIEKLGRYEIREMDNGQLFWKSPGGVGSLKRGRCHIKGSILFLEPGEIEQSELMKKEFMQQLNQLPDWVRTKYFCAIYAIYYSSTGARCRRLGEEKDGYVASAEYITARNKTFGAGKNIKPAILSKSVAKDELTSFFKQFQMLVILTLRILFKCFHVIYLIIKSLTGKWIRFKG